MAPSFSSYKVNITLAILTMLLISSSAHNEQFHPFFYSQSCPNVWNIVHQVVLNAIKKEPRMGASLLRLHFHDCFVNGCDGSVLLDDTDSFKGEKSAGPNKNSLRGFEVVDQIKAALEDQCPGVVSCADILALAASESVYQLGGLPWNFLGWGPGLALRLGRRDALTASQAAANKSLPAPTLDLNGLITNFMNVGLSKHDLIVLSGAHTIGRAKCSSFKSRIYNKTEMIDSTFAQTLEQNCPRNSVKGVDKLAPLDVSTPDKFDSSYYANLVDKKGLLHSDQQLYNNDSITNSIVMMYSANQFAFYYDFAVSMIKMSELRLLLGEEGEIRENCRKPNTPVN